VPCYTFVIRPSEKRVSDGTLASARDRRHPTPLLQRIHGLDSAVEAWVAGRRSGPLDATAHLLSSAADRSKLWAAIALVRALTDRETGRQAGARALVTVAIQSALVEGLVKRATRRDRPGSDVPLRFRARRPPSTSFPSGHAASAAAAAVLLADGRPGWRAPLAVLAVGVAWSRVQTGLHHLSDILAGLALGAAVGLLVRRLLPLPGSTERVAGPQAPAAGAGAPEDLRVH
jgi:undecaprenyl-diphosphatase